MSHEIPGIALRNRVKIRGRTPITNDEWKACDERFRSKKRHPLHPAVQALNADGDDQLFPVIVVPASQIHEREDATIVSGLVVALDLYMKLDADRRLGCEISDEDWAVAHQAGAAALAKLREAGELTRKENG